MATQRRSDEMGALAAENAALRTENHVLYNFVETCRDWLKMMRADLAKIHRAEVILKAAKRARPTINGHPG